MGKKLAIKGHQTRGKEVIELLEMMGGVNGKINKRTGKAYNIYNGNYFISEIGNVREVAYYIDFESQIRCIDIKDITTHFIVYSLEMFLKTFPFKVDDRVIDEADGCPGVVCEMKWDEDVSDMKYCVAFGNGIDFGWFANDSIEFCKENENLEETKSNQDIDKDVFRKEFCECCGSQRCSGQDDELEYCERFKNLMDNSGKPLDNNENKFPPFEPMFKMNDELEYMVPDGYEITEASKDKVFIKPIKSKYPKTLGDCCKVIVDIGDYQMCGYKHELLFNFQNLLICRDAYWKIAGEEMGLGKPWEPDWENYNEYKYCLYITENNVNKGIFYNDNHILAFPTEEMRDTFYVNFKDLIDKCKELL